MKAYTFPQGVDPDAILLTPEDFAEYWKALRLMERFKGKDVVSLGEFKAPISPLTCRGAPTQKD